MAPIEILWRGAGHPVPHDTFYLDIVDVKNGKTVEYTIRRDVVVGNARILDWSTLNHYSRKVGLVSR
jgi:hypothetical protein